MPRGELRAAWLSLWHEEKAAGPDRSVCPADGGGFAWAWVRSAPEREERRRMLESARRLKEIGEAILRYSNDGRGAYPRTLTAPLPTAAAPAR